MVNKLILLALFITSCETTRTISYNCKEAINLQIDFHNVAEDKCLNEFVGNLDKEEFDKAGEDYRNCLEGITNTTKKELVNIFETCK